MKEPHNYLVLSNLAGFLCNVREPYDPDTLMPVHFNKTCNVEGSYNATTGLAINPDIDRPVDRARELYYTALQHLPDKLALAQLPAEDDDDAPILDLRPLGHGQFFAAVAPALEVHVTSEEVDSRIAELQRNILQLQALRT